MLVAFVATVVISVADDVVGDAVAIVTQELTRGTRRRRSIYTKIKAIIMPLGQKPVAAC